MAYVTVIGTGTMATGIAAGFLGADVPIVILGRTQEKAQQCLNDAIALCAPEKRGAAGSSRAGEIDALIFKDVLRQAALRGLLSAEELERWLQYRDSRNLTAHDYGEELAEGSLKLIELFQLDLTRLHKVLVEKHG